MLLTGGGVGNGLNAAADAAVAVATLVTPCFFAFFPFSTVSFLTAVFPVFCNRQSTAELKHYIAFLESRFSLVDNITHSDFFLRRLQT